MAGEISGTPSRPQREGEGGQHESAGRCGPTGLLLLGMARSLPEDPPPSKEKAVDRMGDRRSGPSQLGAGVQAADIPFRHIFSSPSRLKTAANSCCCAVKVSFLCEPYLGRVDDPPAADVDVVLLQPDAVDESRQSDVHGSGTAAPLVRPKAN